MERMTLFADVLLPLPVKGLFTYRIPFELNDRVKVGQRVAVQFGRKKVYAGLIRHLHQQVPEHAPKYILHLLDENPLVNPIQYEFWEWIASYYMCTEGEVMHAALPSTFKLASESKVLLSETFLPDKVMLDENEFQITEALLENKKLTVDEIAKKVGFAKVLPVLRNMIDRKLIYMEEELDERYKPKKEKMVRLAAAFKDEESLRILMEDLGQRAHKQLELFMGFISLAGMDFSGTIETSRTVLLAKTNSNTGVLKTLADKGVFDVYDRHISRFAEESAKASPADLQLSPHQEEAYLQINKAFDTLRVVLLHGVTSGGKTEIYIKLIEQALKNGKQVLYLLPEIALTAQIINRLQKYFGDEVGIYHSRYNMNERAEVWNNISERDGGELHKAFRIILGPRSAIFLPFTNLGLIIVDEEHDASYKQFDPAPRYNARDAAIYLATMHDAKVILGSATPAIETYYNALHGKFGLAHIEERYGGVQMPDIEVVDMREQQRRRMLKSHFSSVLMDHLSSALALGHQAILFQNRRGFSLRLECDQCNWVPQCKNCDVTLTYHKGNELLKCHYCGFSSSIPSDCGGCGSHNLQMKGFGTEKVEEELAILLPDVKIDRMDLDSTRSKNAFHRIFSDFENRKTHILTGTQMVTKGLDFDNVHVVGVLSADNMLSYPDFRSNERSYQLMAQVSGRAGRKNKQGVVIIQSWQPAHPIIKLVVKNDYLGMYKLELKAREEFRYPPFYRMIIIRMKHKDAKLLHEASAVFGNDLRSIFGRRLQGPEFPLVARVRSFYIKQMTLKTARSANQDETKKILNQALVKFRSLATYKSVMVHFDVDPM